MPAGPVLHLPAGLRGADLPDVPPVADVPPVPCRARRGRRAGPLDRSELFLRERARRPALPVYSLLTSVTRTGWVSAAGGSGYQTAQLPPAGSWLHARWRSATTQQVAGPDSLENLTADVRRQRVAGGSTSTARDCRASSPRTTAAGTTSATSAPGIRTAGRPPPGSSRCSRWPPSRPRRLGRPLQLTDLNGDGQLCAVAFAPPAAG